MMWLSHEFALELTFFQGFMSFPRLTAVLPLWAKSAGRCQFDACNKLLWRDGITQLEMNFAEVAHIIGDSPKGPRGDIELSKSYCQDIENLMLMCPEHHKMIDEIYDVYSVDVLRQMKKAHEERIERLTALMPDKTSHVILYTGMIGNHLPKINHRDAWKAMFPGWYPSNRLSIELGISNSTILDNELEYWKFEELQLIRQFEQKVKPVLDSSGERNHFSVFAFAPQPLLIKFGSLLSDIYPAEVYQLHREPPTWEWQVGPAIFEYIIEKPDSAFQTVILNLSLSATVRSDRIQKLFGTQEHSVWKMTIPDPYNDYLRSREQLQLFREEFRKLLNLIKLQHGENALIHLFSAVPVSVAIEIGRVWQPKSLLKKPLISRGCTLPLDQKACRS